MQVQQDLDVNSMIDFVLEYFVNIVCFIRVFIYLLCGSLLSLGDMESCPRLADLQNFAPHCIKPSVGNYMCLPLFSGFFAYCYICVQLITN